MKKLCGKPNELASYLFLLDKDKDYTIEEYKPLRGIQANRYFHKLVNELAKYNRSIGHAISDDEMKVNMNTSYGTLLTDENGKVAWIKAVKGTPICTVYPYTKLFKSDDTGDYYMFYKRTSELNSKEFYELIKGVERECKDVGIQTLDDIEFERMMKEYDVQS